MIISNTPNFYNKVYTALKGINSNIKVGGWYTVVEGSGSNAEFGTPIQYWTRDPLHAGSRDEYSLDYFLTNCTGLDILLVDKTVTHGGHDTTVYTDAQVMRLVKYTKSIIERMRTRPKYLQRFSNVPIWISEIYIGNPRTDNAQYQKAQWTSLIRHSLLGARHIEIAPMFWQPEENLGGLYGWFTQTENAGGGYEIVPGPYSVWKMYNDNFPAGTMLRVATSNSLDIEAIASPTNLMLINKGSTQTIVDIAGLPSVNLAPHDVQVVSSIQNISGPPTFRSYATARSA